MKSGLFTNCYLQTISLPVIYSIHVYKQDLELNNLEGLICHETEPTNQPTTADKQNLQIMYSICVYKYTCIKRIWH